MAGHAKLSPSGSARWITCPGSVALSADIKGSDDYKLFAEEGTAAHELGELSLLNREEPKTYKGRRLNPCPTHNPEGFLVDDEMIKHIDTYVNYVYETIDVHNDVLEIEKQVSLFYSPDETGTADVVAIQVGDKTLHVIDLKYGQGVAVDAADNTQLLIYGLSAYDEYMDDGIYEIEKVVCHIVQPRKFSITSAEYTVAQLEAFREPVMDIVADIAAGSQKFCPSQKGCQWCPASGICEPQAKAHMETLTKEFDNMDKLPVDANLLGIAELAQVLSKKKEIENWLKSVESVCFSRLDKGLELPGYKMVAGRSVRKWADEDAAAKFLKRRMPADDVFKQRIISPTQAEKVVEITPRSVKLWKSLVVKPEGKPTIAKDSDKRPALVATVDEFEDLDTFDEL